MDKARPTNRPAEIPPVHPTPEVPEIPVETGDVHAVRGGIFRVNGKDYDAYDAVCRVVAAEIGNGNYESIKAQAVATYTLLYKRNQNGNYPTGLSMGTPSSTVKQAVKEVWGEAHLCRRVG